MTKVIASYAINMDTTGVYETDQQATIEIGCDNMIYFTNRDGKIIFIVPRERLICAEVKE